MSLSSKILAAEDLKKVLSSNKKGRVVFTNGCFDILHKGHVNYLEQARALGDILIVALNSDGSVGKIKGPTRPINPLTDRLEVMAALESVSYVTWFEEENPLQIIQLLSPDVLVKGGDWQIDQIIGAKEVLSWGGKVESLPYVEGRSTTGILEKLKAAK